MSVTVEVPTEGALPIIGAVVAVGLDGVPITGGGTPADGSITNAKLANMANARIKGRATAGTGVPEDLTGAQAAALLPAVVGDSGTGGTKGLVPAPAAGDAAAGKFLKADGGWDVPTGDMAKSVYDPQNAGKISGNGTSGGTGGILSMVGADGASAGSITTDALSANAGQIDTSSVALSSSPGGDIITKSGVGGGSDGGSIVTKGGAAGAPGGSINTKGSDTLNKAGGSINTSAATDAGGSIDTHDGGGSINTRGNGSIELGSDGTRTTITGTATANRALTLPDFDSMTVGVQGGWTANQSAGDPTINVLDFVEPDFTATDAGAFNAAFPETVTALAAMATQINRLTKKFQAVEAALADKQLPSA